MNVWYCSASLMSQPSIQYYVYIFMQYVDIVNQLAKLRY